MKFFNFEFQTNINSLFFYTSCIFFILNKLMLNPKRTFRFLIEVKKDARKSEITVNLMLNLLNIHPEIYWVLCHKP